MNNPYYAFILLSPGGGSSNLVQINKDYQCNKVFMNVGGESESNDKIESFKNYLGYEVQASSINRNMSQEDEIISSLFAALKSRKKYYVQIAKSFDTSGLNSALLYIYKNLLSGGVEVRTLESLAFSGLKLSKDENVIFLISEKHIDTSDPVTVQVVSDLIAGTVPRELAGTPIILGLTEGTLRRIGKFHGKRTLENPLNPPYRQIGNNRMLGAGLILLSITFLVTGIGTIINRPMIYFLSVFTVSWVIFSLSIIGIIGFILVLFGYLQTRSKKYWTLGTAFLIIVAAQLASVFIQTSSLSLDSEGWFKFVLPTQNIFPRFNVFTLAEIYTVLAMLLAIACYLIIYSLATHLIKIVALIALIAGIAAEIFTMVGVLHISSIFFPHILIYYGNYLFISFYNNVTPILPYPSVFLNVTDFIYPIQKYTELFLYFEVVLASISNFLFCMHLLLK